MANVFINDSYFTNIANAIRTLNGLTTTYKPSEMAAAIDALDLSTVEDNLLASIIERSVTTISNSTATIIKEYTLSYCSNLTSATFSAVTSIKEGGFYMCTALTDVNLPLITTIGSSTFYGCSSLQTITLPATDCLIGNYAFQNCTSLEKVDCTNCGMIRAYAFYGCSSLKTLILRSDWTNKITSISSSSALDNPMNEYGGFYIYVPSALKSMYLSNSSWKSYSSHIRTIEDYPDICG